jgi:shikimate dehydrogenase
MQAAALAAAGLGDWRYQRLPVPPEWFEDTVLALPGAGFRGANVTIPFKERALALSGRPSPRARAIGAANTLVFEPGGAVRADNTDAPALIDALPEAATGGHALVLGAGGTARAAVWALRHAGAARVSVLNRTPDRARALCAELGGEAVPGPVAADLLVNCTAIGLRPGEDALKELGLPADSLMGYRCVVDYVYGEQETRLVQAARARAVPVIDGLELLVRQGALSFGQFTGRQASLAAMRAALSRA